jgi:hypothetical protein
VSRDYDPVPGQWYEDLETSEVFQVVSLDPDNEVLRIHWLEGETEALDLEDWTAMDVEPTQAPEGWVDEENDDLEEDDKAEKKAAKKEEEEDDEDEDDWDDDDEDEDWDDDEDDGYSDRNG